MKELFSNCFSKHIHSVAHDFHKKRQNYKGFITIDERKDLNQYRHNMKWWNTDLNRKGIVFIFGAGASKAENAPIAGELLYKTLTSPDLRNDGHVVELRNFLKEYFYANVDDLENNPLPTFEEVLTIVDISLARQEDFSSTLDYEKLFLIRDSLIYSIARILEIYLRDSGVLHRKFVKNLFNANENIWRRISFINLNYDLLLDNALIGLYESKDLDLDYSIDFRNYVDHRQRNRNERADFIQNPEEWYIPRQDRSVLLLKPHGSLNWLYCPNCNTVKTTKTEKGALRVWTERAVCEKDQSRQKTLLIPPTWEKAYDNAHLTRIAQRTYEILRKANEVLFIGYSLADADIKLKYLFKRALYDHEPNSRPKITVILKKNRSKQRTDELRERYQRFLGPDVSFDFRGFEYLARHPLEFLQPTDTR